MKDYNHAKPNPENSSIIQSLLDIKASGASAHLVDELLEILRTNKKILGDADELFRSHQYPSRALDWCKVQNNVEFSRFLSPKATAVLTAMYQNMWHGNLIQLSHRDIIRIAKIGSLSSVKVALDELTDNGCIAIKIPGTTRRPTVYMVNPLIATIGSKLPHLEEQFWMLTGTKYYYDKKGDGLRKRIRSTIQIRWQELTASRTYSKGRETLEVNDQKITFHKINEAPITDKKLRKKPQTDKIPAKKKKPKNKPDTKQQTDKTPAKGQQEEEKLPFDT